MTSAPSMDVMNGLPAPSRFKPRPHSSRYITGFAIAVGLHAIILTGWQRDHSPVVPDEQAEFGVEFAESSVEVALVAAPPAEEVVEEPVVEQPPEPEPEPVIETPPPPEPEPVPEPEPLQETPVQETPPPPEETPIVEKPVLPPQPVATPPPAPKPKPALRKPAPKRPVGDGSSPIPGNDATTQSASAGASSSKAGYLRNPHPAYPADAKKAGQQGVVVLAVIVDANGRPTSVTIQRSSGYSSLDNRAQSTVASRWMFKPAKQNGVAVSSRLTIPIRFTLH